MIRYFTVQAATKVAEKFKQKHRYTEFARTQNKICFYGEMLHGLFLTYHHRIQQTVLAGYD